MIIFDGIHIASTVSMAELHAFAAQVGLKRCWFHKAKRHGHYDKPVRMDPQILLDAGAKQVGIRELARTMARR